jgi:WhiB family redox-sensing transcriptional regulator
MLTPPTLTHIDASWRRHGACRGLDPDMFFPQTDEEAGPAKAVCAGCGVRERCLDHALGYRERDGVWGGMTERERRRIIRQRRRRSA